MSALSLQPDLQKLCIERVDRCLVLAQKQFGQPIERPEITFDLRGRAAGQLRFSRGPVFVKARLRFNSEMLGRYSIDFIEQVVPHEVGHYLAYLKFGNRIKPHGKEWRYVVEGVLGAEASVTHSFEVQAARKLKRFVYACNCPNREHELSAIRHGRVSKRRAQYYCRACKCGLEFVREANF